MARQNLDRQVLDRQVHPKKLHVAILLSGALALAACGGEGGFAGMGKSESLGTAGGAVAGGLAGYAISGGTLGTVIGAVAGGVIGNRLGNWLKGDSQSAAAQAAVRAAESGERVTWKKTGATFEKTEEGWAQPTGNMYSRDGRSCRDIHQSATKGNETRQDTVTLCRGQNGWVPA